MYEIPFAVGLQIINADDASKGRIKDWAYTGSRIKIDARAKIEELFL